MLNIAVTNTQSRLSFDAQQHEEAVRIVLQNASLESAEISVAVVDDSTIQRVHLEYLDIDEPTDVLSFVLEESKTSPEGEIVVSADTALKTAPEFGWSAEDELLLYVIHGALHLVGYDDTTQTKREQMRRQEDLVLKQFGKESRWETSDDASAASSPRETLSESGGTNTS